MVSSIKTILETGLIIRKEDIFSRMRRTLYAIFFPVEASIEYKIKEIEKPKNVITGKIIVPKEIGKYNKLGKELWKWNQICHKVYKSPFMLRKHNI